ncbi:hypothetical protein LEP1GSC034_0995 [Leptospira interrogans str. 2003000735]|uniref:Uncharacterized protein n=1 Tax=Leptospira interrogans str. 2002000626 TaxID=996803 RepID=A0A829D1W1_LEPIR|nr:hypothetical protein LEP1GSC027_3946 [Leptospira interrogans str. 2002000624]EKQ40350.1 hypothetical protein LEP1GSC025_2141 [Leptospira interrogans str. 2002000621]EMJ68666.1 hypothetical protein LEP1GSC034_0797 [Leptospira interrogans str. 2003000735]EMJ76839.1 hypothetical protein LEP1GSC032_0608 [Leptospira interrogans str. 2002000631]EMY06242.1 hypothetical protein LEP1GSC029_3132 [Leptospira interrogans str. 2002000626]
MNFLPFKSSKNPVGVIETCIRLLKFTNAWSFEILISTVSAILVLISSNFSNAKAVYLSDLLFRAMSKHFEPSRGVTGSVHVTSFRNTSPTFILSILFVLSTDSTVPLSGQYIGKPNFHAFTMSSTNDFLFMAVDLYNRF